MAVLLLPSQTYGKAIKLCEYWITSTQEWTLLLSKGGGGATLPFSVGPPQVELSEGLFLVFNEYEPPVTKTAG